MVQIPLGIFVQCHVANLAKLKDFLIIALLHTGLSLTVLEACDSDFSGSMTIYMHFDGQQGK